jgi:hypothetical protein
MVAKLADHAARPVRALGKEKRILRNSVAIGATGAPTISGDPGVSITRSSPGVYALVFPACPAATIIPVVAKSSTLAGVRLTAKDASAGTATLETVAAAGTDVTIAIPADNGWYENDGTPLAAFADAASPTPGLALDDSEAAGIRWNNHANPDPIVRAIVLPANYNEASNLTLTIVASKTGATVGDAVTFDVIAFAHPVGALRDADANLGGVSSAMTGDATSKTVQAVTRTLAAADVPAGPVVLTLSIQPTDGTLGTDDVTVHGLYLTQTSAADPANGDIIDLTIVGQVSDRG